MNDDNVKKRVKAVRVRLAGAGLNCLIISKRANVTYATGFLGDDSWAVVTPGAVYLLTDSRYGEQAGKQCRNCRIIERNERMVETVGKLVRKLKSVQTAAVEGSISVGALKSLRKHVGVRLKSVESIVETIRSVKDDGEVRAIRAAVRLGADALERTRDFVKPGITENELAGVLDFEIRKLGAGNSFETIVAFGANGSRPHHRPGMRRLRENDCVLIDFGVKHGGYCCDLTRCFSVGKVSRLYGKVYEAVSKAQRAAIEEVRDGVRMEQVDAVAKEVIAGYDLPIYGHGTGHGLGLEVHELPVVAGNNKEKLRAGQVITIEPGVYLPGKLGVRIEDDVLVTQSGCTVLSKGVK